MKTAPLSELLRIVKIVEVLQGLVAQVRSAVERVRSERFDPVVVLVAGRAAAAVLQRQLAESGPLVAVEVQALDDFTVEIGRVAMAHNNLTALTRGAALAIMHAELGGLPNEAVALAEALVTGGVVPHEYSWLVPVISKQSARYCTAADAQRVAVANLLSLGVPAVVTVDLPPSNHPVLRALQHDHRLAAVTTPPHDATLRIVAAPDDDLALRHALRQLREALGSGRTLHELAIVLPDGASARAYGRLAHGVLDQSELAWWGPSSATLRATRAGRMVYKALASWVGDASWAVHATRLDEVLREEEPPGPRNVRERERRARLQLIHQVAELRALDRVAPSPTAALFVDVVVELLNRPAPSCGRPGFGIAVGSAEFMRGTWCADVAVHDDVLRLDIHADTLHRVVARTDLLTERVRQPSDLTRLVLHEVAGPMATPSVLWDGEADWLSRVESFSQSMELAAATPGEFGIQIAMRNGKQTELAVARDSEAFTRFDGFAGPNELVGTLSPSALQRFTRCQFSFFLHDRLHLHSDEQDEDAVALDAPRRGVTLHRVLELFFRSEEVPKPDVLWSNAARDRAYALLGDELAQVARLPAYVAVANSALWPIEEASLSALVSRFLDTDNAYRAEFGAVPLAYEQSFGSSDGELLELDISGVAVNFRGVIDRIDRHADGTIAVIDYKTGKRRSSEDFVLALYVYSQYAERQFGAHRVVVGPWYLSERVGPRFTSLSNDREPIEKLEAAVADLRSGRFPIDPGSETPWGYSHCGRCPYDSICPSNRIAVRDRKHASASQVVDDSAGLPS